MMEDKKTSLTEQVEKVFQDIGGFTWEQAETWAGFCNAVGMEPLPYLKVMLNNICDVKVASDKGSLPSCAASPELWVVSKGFKTSFKLIEPV